MSNNGWTAGFPRQTRGSQLLPRVYEILVILASKYMGLMGDSWASVRDSARLLDKTRILDPATSDGPITDNSTK